MLHLGFLSIKKITLNKMKVVLIFIFSIHLLMQDAFCVLTCSEENNANKVCMNGKNQSFPIQLDTLLYLREIVKINEEENSITLQMVLYNSWTNSMLAPSNATKL